MSAIDARVEPAPRPTVTRHRRLAQVVTEISGPGVCAAAGLLTVAVHTAGNGAGAAWGAAAAVLAAGVPMAYIAKGVRAGRWDDHHIGERRSRTVPLIVAATSVAVCVVVLIAVRAPRELVALVVAMLVGLLVVMTVTRWWKVSIHTSVAAGLLAILVILFGPWALAGLPVLAAVAWSRTVLDAHTWPQVVVGAALGGAVASTVFPLLR